MLMKPDFTTLTKAQLREYVLANRDDIDAIRLLFTPPEGVEIKQYPAIYDENGRLIEENLCLMEQVIQERIAQGNS